jgi:hypothetical protein
MVNGHLHVAIFGVNVSQQFMSLTFLIAGAGLKFALAHF